MDNKKSAAKKEGRTKKSLNKLELKSRFYKLLRDLIIVIIGVYLAFSLTNFRQGQRDYQRKMQMYEAFVEELSTLSEVSHTYAPITDSLCTMLDQLVKGGEPIPFYSFYSRFDFRADMWNAALESEAIELLDIPLLAKMSSFYGEVNALDLSFQKLNILTREYLTPNLEKDDFYNPKTKKLKLQYQCIIQAWTDIDNRLERIGEQADSLIVLIQKSM